MIDALAITITLACLATAGVAAVPAVFQGVHRLRLAPTLVLIEIALAVQAVLDLAGLVGGHRPRELSTHLAYLVASVGLIPLAVTQTRHDEGRWAAVLLAVALVVLAVLVIRLQVTWRSATG